MKNVLRLISFAAISVLVFTSCEGPMGPYGRQGERGERGEQGPRGERGDDGKDATCNLCHKPARVRGIEDDYYRFSTHGLAPNFRQNFSGSCAPCHTHEGFMYAVSENLPANAYTIPNDNKALTRPKSFNCYTCHDFIHTKYDWTLTTTAEVPLVMWGGEKTINFTGNAASSNLCVKCHQPRRVTGANMNQLALSPSAVHTPTLTSISVHYSPEAVLFAGIGGVEFEGSEPYAQSRHRTIRSGVGISCADCHMANTNGLSEGHTFIATLKGCTVSCHGTDEAALATRMTLIVAEIDGLLTQLFDKINEIGGGTDIITNSGSLVSGHPQIANLTNAHIGAIINYQLVFNDAGAKAGAHNYPYIVALLKNSIEALN